jgi:beta-lactamase regulating signal transducer with metallopeptidase domain
MDGSVGAAVVAGGVIAISLLLKATLILGVAWILAVAARRSSAAVRHGIWVAALLGAVTLPLTTLWLPPLRIELPVGLVGAGTRYDGPDAPAVALPTLGADATALSGGVAAPVGGSVIGNRFATEPRDTPGLDWLLTLLAAWLLGTLARAGWLAAQLARVRHLTRYAAAPVRDDRLRAVGDIKRLLRTRRPVVLLESARIATPLTYGLLRPVILLPEDSREWPEDRLRVVLLHELAHIRRWDYVTCLIAEAACALYWPVPLVWVARRSVQAEQEQASDDLVLAAGTPAVDYADHLLAIARTLRGESRTLAATIGMAREIGLKRRIRTILDGRTRRNPLRSWHGAVTLLALCGFSLPVAAIRAGTGVAEGAADLSASALAPALQPGMPAPGVTPPEADVYLWLEAEHGILRGAMEPREDLDASDGHFVAAAGERDAGEAILSLNLPRAGRYALWARVAGGTTDDRGLTISLDDRELGLTARDESGESSRDWRWIRLGDAGSDFLLFEPGIHTLRLLYSSGDRRLDRVLVTSDDAYLPSGRGASPVGFLPQYSWIDVGVGAVTGATEYVF